MPRRNQRRAAARLLTDTGLASMEVVASRLSGLADPDAFLSPRQQREVGRMVSEKMHAGSAGIFAAWGAMATMPWQMMAGGVAPTDGWRLWMQGIDLWTGVGNAALRPVRQAAVANRTRLRRRRKP